MTEFLKCYSSSPPPTQKKTKQKQSCEITAKHPTPLTTLLIAVFFDLGEGKPKGKAKKHDMEKTARQSRKRVL